VTLDELLLQHAGQASLATYVVVLGGIGLLELARPVRATGGAGNERWFASAGLWIANLFAIPLVLPVTLVGFTLAIAQRDMGLLRAFDVPYPLAIAIGFLALDLRAWLFHWLLHRSSLLWRVHRVHHSDLEFDMSTALRFHPIEALGAVGTKILVVALLGPPVAGVLLFEFTYVAVSLFNHSNVRMPAALDRVARLVFVTPDVHRIHHSVHEFEARANLGTMFSFWDRLFRTMREQPVDGHAAMQLGDPELQDPAVQTLRGLMLLPFRVPTSAPAEDRGPALGLREVAHPIR
jgi:sterol desaturase/sphingolipid hydroxylase (fatty acid hydroxylase superfamily)